jgi:hypothetical protein
MNHAISFSSAPARRSTGREAGSSSYPDRVRPRRERHPRREHARLARYIDADGRPREVLTRQGSGGSVLVLDCDAATGGDLRLLAHLAADEPAENAAIVCRHYLEHSPGQRRRCRKVTRQDAQSAPFSEEHTGLEWGPVPPDVQPVDPRGCSYGLGHVQTGMSIPELRWRRHCPEGRAGEAELVSLREAVACLESYEPLRTLTLRALAQHRGGPGISTTALRSELERVQESPIVLNRRLRKVTLATIERQGLSMSEIAIRCGRVKHDCRGNQSGETSWLARRLGLLPEGGQNAPTPWVHTDVLALIARRGLGISPREVEL